MSIDKRFHGVTQQYQFAVKKMFGAWQNLQLRSRLEFVYPGDGFLDIDQFILVTLQN
jgi:hypothetical protein